MPSIFRSHVNLYDCHAKSNIQQLEGSFHQQIGLTFQEETSKFHIWSRALYGAETCRSEIPGKFQNVVLQKNGDQLDQLY